MRRVAAIVAAVAVLAGAARAQDLPDQRPMLRIEPGMHTAQIKRIGVDRACKLIVTGSEDKTARLWALPESARGARLLQRIWHRLRPRPEDGHGAPRLLRTLRVPIGDGNDGKIYAVALSPDGKYVAAGGWDARYSIDKTMFVYIFEAGTGRLVTRLGRFGNVINHLAFSPDGRRLAATLHGGEGMRLWEIGGWRLIAEDKDYGGMDSYGAAFGANGTLYTVADGGALRRYGANGALEAKAVSEGGKDLHSIAVHPDGTKFAVGFDDTAAVEVYDARTLKRLYAADTSGIPAGALSSAGWSADGARLYAGGRGYKVGGKNPLVIWQEAGRGRRSDVPLSADIIMQVLPCGDGMAAGAGDPAFGLSGPDGAKRVWQEGVTADMRDKKREAFTLSSDGGRVRFGLGQGEATPVLFDLAAFDLRNAPQADPGLAAPKISGIAVSEWENDRALKLAGKPIVLERYEMARALAIAPDASRFVIGADWSMRAYRADGGKLWQKPVPDVAFGVNISRDGKLVVATYGDGTVRWHRLSDGKELLALFVHSKDHRFVAWTPKGYYAASPGAEDLIGWHVNRDWDHAPDFVPASRFHDQFNRPDIVKRVLGDLDEDKAIAEANRLAGVARAEEIAKQLPPVITVLPPAEGGTFATGSLTIRYTLRSPSGLPVSQVSALVDGRPLPGATTKGIVPVSASDDVEGTLTLTGLPQRDVTLTLVARSGDLESSPDCQDNPACILLKFRGTPAANAPKGSLYAVIVGVGEFEDPNVKDRYRLKWAAKDARDFAAALERQKGRLYRDVVVTLLVEKTADNASIINSLQTLESQVGPDDLGVVFLSGHGMTDPSGDYYFVSYNAKMESKQGRLMPVRATSVPGSEFTNALKLLSGNALFFFDTCFAGDAAEGGGLDYNKLINGVAGKANAIVFASSTGAELSHERDDWQHGAFTKALLDGLAGGADYDHDGKVTVDALNLYMKNNVPRLTGDQQHPVDLRPHAVRNFDFALVP